MAPPPYHLKFTKGSTTITLLLGRDGQEAPLIRLGTKSQEAVGSGTRGSIRIDTQHGGAGQKVARDPARYLLSDGWDAFIQGILRPRGQISNTVLSADSTIAAPGNSVYRAGFLSDPNVQNIYVTPKGIFEVTTLKLAPGAGNHFTGSAAVFGDRVFFGRKEDADNDSLASSIKAIGGAYALATGPVASYFKVIGKKMFRVRYVASTRVGHVSWTEETGSDGPTFTQEYPFSTGGRQIVDVSAIGPHLIIALSATNLPGHVLSMDDEGRFTSIIPDGIGVSELGVFAPYLGGQIIPVAGKPRVLWFQDIFNVSLIEFECFVWPDEQVNFGVVLGATSMDDEILIAFNTAGDNQPYVVSGHLMADGWKAHQRFRTTAGYNVMGARVTRVSGLRALQIIATHETNDDLRVFEIRMWEGSKAPGLVDGQVKRFKTSLYNGGSWVTKVWTTVKGYFEVGT